MGDDQHKITRLLQRLEGGDREAIDQLLPLVYEQLRVVARYQRLQWRGRATLNTTALVHEAYLRLVEGAKLELENRRHFLHVAAKTMRYVLLDYAKARKRLKRGGDLQRVSLDAAFDVPDPSAAALIDLDTALSRLEKVNQRGCRIVECRFFADMTIEDTAEVLGLSTATVKRGWLAARAWLYREMHPSSPA